MHAQVVYMYQSALSPPTRPGYEANVDVFSIKGEAKLILNVGEIRLSVGEVKLSVGEVKFSVGEVKTQCGRGKLSVGLKKLFCCN